MNQLRPIVDCQNVLGESVRWHASDQRLFWTDIERAELWTLDPSTSRVSVAGMKDRPCSIVPRSGGGLLIAFSSYIALFENALGTTYPIANSGPDEAGTRWNDGRCDRKGRFLIGSSCEKADGPALASLWQFTKKMKRRQLVTGLRVSNALCFSPDGTVMYFADSMEACIWAFDYDEDSGNASRRREFCSLKDQPGIPDGATVDEEGFLWNAQWGGGRIIRYTPDGSIDRVLELPTSQPTCVAFGGPDLATLFVTTARLGMSEDQLGREPLAGSLFAVETGIRGLPENPYAG